MLQLHFCFVNSFVMFLFSTTLQAKKLQREHGRLSERRGHVDRPFSTRAKHPPKGWNSLLKKDAKWVDFDGLHKVDHLGRSNAFTSRRTRFPGPNR